jgi:hypothetical protein
VVAQALGQCVLQRRPDLRQRHAAPRGGPVHGALQAGVLLQGVQPGCQRRPGLGAQPVHQALHEGGAGVATLLQGVQLMLQTAPLPLQALQAQRHPGGQHQGGGERAVAAQQGQLAACCRQGIKPAAQAQDDAQCHRRQQAQRRHPGQIQRRQHQGQRDDDEGRLQAGQREQRHTQRHAQPGPVRRQQQHPHLCRRAGLARQQQGQQGQQTQHGAGIEADPQRAGLSHAGRIQQAGAQGGAGAGNAEAHQHHDRLSARRQQGAGSQGPAPQAEAVQQGGTQHHLQAVGRRIAQHRPAGGRRAPGQPEVDDGIGQHACQHGRSPGAWRQAVEPGDAPGVGQPQRRHFRRLQRGQQRQQGQQAVDQGTQRHIAPGQGVGARLQDRPPRGRRAVSTSSASPSASSAVPLTQAARRSEGVSASGSGCIQRSLRASSSERG